jgi:tape measure domain-containing protein
MAGVIQTVTISVAQQGAQQVTRAIEDIGKGAASASTAVDLLVGSLGALGIKAGLSDLANALDTMQQIENRIRLVTDSVEEQNAVWHRLVDIATQVRQPVEALSTLYGRMALVAQDLHASQEKLLEVTGSIAAAMTISGTNTQEARGAMIELSDALSAGSVTGREWQSVMNQVPVLARAVADGFRQMASSQEGHVVLGKTMSDLNIEMLKLPQSLGLVKQLIREGKLESETS